MVKNENSILNEKIINIIINPDPKSLWKNIESDRSDPYWKEDDVMTSSDFLDKKIVVASKRGRSHANVGSFRDDDFAFKKINETGWSAICVADGAGGYPLTRQGSKLACDSIIKYFEENFNEEYLSEFDETLLKSIKILPSLDLVFFDGNHRKEPTLRYFHSCLKGVNNNSIFVFDDIHWSKEMHQAWNEIIQHPDVTISVDLFRMGIVFFRKESKKQHFTIRF